MLKNLVLFIGLTIGLFVFVPGYAAAQNGGAGNSRLERQIRKEILTLPYYNVFDVIGYQINGSSVTLTGYVTRPTTKKDAEESVRDIAGVSEVFNRIEVLPLSPSDDRIRYRVLQTFVNRGGSLYRYFMGANPSIRIIVNRGRVSLEGYADTKGDSNLAYILARGVSGTFGVTNNLKVDSDNR